MVRRGWCRRRSLYLFVNMVILITRREPKTRKDSSLKLGLHFLSTRQKTKITFTFDCAHLHLLNKPTIQTQHENLTDLVDHISLNNTIHHAHVFSTFAIIKINCCTRPWICEDFTCAKKRRRKSYSSSVWTGTCMPLFRTPLQESRDSQKSHDGNPAEVPTHVRAVGHQDCRVSSAMNTHKGNMANVLGTTLFFCHTKIRTDGKDTIIDDGRHHFQNNLGLPGTHVKLPKEDEEQMDIRGTCQRHQQKIIPLRPGQRSLSTHTCGNKCCSFHLVKCISTTQTQNQTNRPVMFAGYTAIVLPTITIKSGDHRTSHKQRKHDHPHKGTPYTAS